VLVPSTLRRTSFAVPPVHCMPSDAIARTYDPSWAQKGMLGGFARRRSLIQPAVR
jgi:hypothetical protein